MIAPLLQRLEPLASRLAGRIAPASQPGKPSVTLPRPVFADVVAQSRLPALDGLRAVGVFGVAVAHSTYGRGLGGDFGPTAFFVLSGFLITRILLREHKRTGTLSLRRFYLARTMRIFPAYYTFVLISYLLDARAGQWWNSAFLGNAVSYTINYFNAFNHHPTTSLAHVWSLAVEEQFYILLPLAFIVLAARGRRFLIAGVGLAAFAGVAWRAWLIVGAHVDTAYVYNAFETRFDNLAVGCLLALCLDYKRVIAAAEWCARRTWYPLVTIALLLSRRFVFAGVYHYAVGFTVDALLIAIFVVQMLQLYRTRMWSWLEWPVVRYLGAISYPMYLYHGWGASVGRRLPGNSPSLQFAAGILAMIVLASGSYHLIELPILKLRPRRPSESRVEASPGGLTQPAALLVRSA